MQKDSLIVFISRNLTSGIVKQFLSAGLNFCLRTVTIYFLGVEYQGLNGVFASILQVLSFTELGFSTAVVFFLYEPLVNENKTRVREILAFLKQIYHYIGVGTLLLGVVITIGLPWIIPTGRQIDVNVYIVSLFYVINAAVSYFFFGYKNTLLVAAKRDDLVNKSYSLSLILIRVLQVIFIAVYGNYYACVICVPIGSIINNLFVENYAKRYFPEYEPDGMIDKEIKSEIIKQVKAIVVGRIADVSRNSFDNMIVAFYCGLGAVAMYDNYYVIFSAVYGLMGVVSHSVMAIIGHRITGGSRVDNYRECRAFSFAFMWMVGACCVTLLLMYQPFMALWMKEKSDLIMSDRDMILFCLYFYVICATYTKNIYADGAGLFWAMRNCYYWESASNIILNVILGYLWGISGILLASIISIIAFNFLGGTKILFDHYFKMPMRDFLMDHFRYASVVLCAMWLAYYMLRFKSFDSIVGCVIGWNASVMVFSILYYWSSKFSSAYNDICLLRGRRGRGI